MSDPIKMPKPPAAPALHKPDPGEPVAAKSAKVVTRKPMSRHIQLVAKLDRILATEDADTARWCLVFLAGQYGILTDTSMTELARRCEEGAMP